LVFVVNNFFEDITNLWKKEKVEDIKTIGDMPFDIFLKFFLVIIAPTLWITYNILCFVIMVIPLGVMVTVAKCFIAIMLIMLVPTLLGIILDYCTEMQKNKKLITFLKFLLDEG
jgi:hypothetical protein